MVVHAEDPHNLLDARPIQLDDSALALVSCCQLNRRYHHKGKRRILQLILHINLTIPCGAVSASGIYHLSSVRHTCPASNNVETELTLTCLSLPRLGCKIKQQEYQSAVVLGSGAFHLLSAQMMIVSGSSIPLARPHYLIAGQVWRTEDKWALELVEECAAFLMLISTI